MSTFKELAENPNFNMISVKGAVGEYDVKVSDILNISFSHFSSSIQYFNFVCLLAIQNKFSHPFYSQGFLKIFKR